MTDESVVIVGGANSAAEAAIHLARFARRVVMLVRGDTLKDGMSEYLIEQLDALTNVEVCLNTEIIDAGDGYRLRTLALHNRAQDTITEHEASGLFILIGATPRTDWLPTGIARDERGFILTGDDAPKKADDASARLPLETTMAGVFAAGDVRHGSTKRIAAAVGEGASAVQQLHRHLSQ